jgi:[ribosomal protein S18]-alanine N-acetyltransferase
VRRATLTDIPAMLELHREASTSAWSPEHYESLFRTDAPELSGYFVLVVEDPSGSEGVFEAAVPSPIVAHLVAHRVDTEWQLQYVVVAKKFQCRGVGAFLLKEFISCVRARAGNRVFLEVRESNQSARRLYHTLGFKETGLRKRYYPNPPEDAILYQLSLS